MSPTSRDDDGSDDPTPAAPQLRYIAPMPVQRQPAQRDGEQERAGAYVAPAPVAEPEVASKPRGGWLGPLAVIVVSIGALAAVFFVTQGGSDSPTPPPSLAVTSSPSPSPSASSSAPSRSSSGPSSSGPSSPSSTAPSPLPSSATPSSSAPTSPPSPSASTSSRPTRTQPAKLPSGVKVCRPGVGAGGTTTCGFANNVASAVGSNAKKSGTFSVKAWSPTTKKDYRLRCTAAPVTVCTGGRAAVIYVAR